MKKLLSTLSLLAALVLFGCSDSQPHGTLTGWSPSGNMLADDLCDSLYIAYGHNHGAEPGEWHQPLESIAAASPDNGKIVARAAYWRVRRLFRRRDFDTAMAELEKGLQRVDSTRYEEDYRRLAVLRWRFNQNLPNRYATAMDNLDFFRATSDSATIATVMMDLGWILEQVGDYSRGAEYCREASDIWRRLGQTEYADKNLLNVALLSGGDIADSLHLNLLARGDLLVDTSFYSLVLRNHYLNTDSLQYLTRALALTGGSRHFRGIHSINCALMADRLSRNTRYDDALNYADTAVALRQPMQDPQYDMLIAHAYAAALHGLGRKAEAEQYYKRYSEIRDSIAAESEKADRLSSQMRYRIRQIDRERLVLVEESRRAAVALAMGIAIILLVVSFFFYRHLKQREISAMMLRNELQQAKSRLGREGIMAQEHDELIKHIGREIEQCESDGTLPTAVSARLRSALRLHNATRDERQAFLDVHDNMLPGFSARLKRAFPGLSERQLKLAAYICAGMSSGAIGRVLNIAPGSVMKSRYRLRAKLGVPPGEALEEFLRRFVDE